MPRSTEYNLYTVARSEDGQCLWRVTDVSLDQMLIKMFDCNVK